MVGKSETGVTLEGAHWFLGEEVIHHNGSAPSILVCPAQHDSGGGGWEEG